MVRLKPHAPLVWSHVLCPSRPIPWATLWALLLAPLPSSRGGPLDLGLGHLEPLKRLTQAGGHASGRKQKLKIVHRRCSRKLIYNSRVCCPGPATEPILGLPTPGSIYVYIHVSVHPIYLSRLAFRSPAA